MKKKVLICVVAVVLVLCCAVGGTIAWLTATTEPVVNIFTVGDINIDLSESENLNLKMVPGNTIAKDPKVTVLEGSEKCYLFVKLEKSGNFDSFLTCEIADGWTPLDGVDNVYYRTVEASDAAQEFQVLAGNEVTVLGTVTKEMMNALTEPTYPKLTVTAYASQFNKNAAEPFTVNEAWTNISGTSGT